MKFKRIGTGSKIAYDESSKTYYGMCSDGKYRKIAPPISRWLMIIE